MTPTGYDWTYGNIPALLERVEVYECASTTFADERDLKANDFSEQFNTSGIRCAEENLIGNPRSSCTYRSGYS